MYYFENKFLRSDIEKLQKQNEKIEDHLEDLENEKNTHPDITKINERL